MRLSMKRPVFLLIR